MNYDYFFDIEQYQLEDALTDAMLPDDSIFSSPQGVFINRGAIGTHPIANLVQILKSMKGSQHPNRKPFIVFGRAFVDVGQTNQVFTIPSEMIHIDDHHWVTHFYISTDRFNSQIQNDSPSVCLENPHHVEMMSPESKDQFIDKVESVLKHIAVGDATKVVIARQLNVYADINIDARLLIGELRDSQPESYVFSVNNYVGASPELLVEKFARSIRCLPMAGTRKRHARRDEDDADIADLQTNIKDRNEHQVVVQDIIEKLEGTATNVTSSSGPHVVRLPHVAHLATSVTATANVGIDLTDLVNVLHPTPAVAGTPTDKAMQIISDIEDFDRGIYGAPVGWIDSSGDGQCAIALRCAKVKDKHAQLYAGVGIVDGSDPEQEWNETQAKFGVMRDAMMNITQ